MAGSKGRSGGSNKKSYWQHRLQGTLNVTRHRLTPATASAAARLADLQAAYSYHAALIATQRETSAGLAAKRAEGQSIDSSALLREMRHQALTLMQLGAAIGRLEREIADAPPVPGSDPFDEFLDEPKWAAARRRAARAVAQ